MTKYYADVNGTYLDGFDGAPPPAGGIEVPEAPSDARQVWNGSGWGPVPPAERQYSFLEFMDLLTEAEQVAIASAAMADVSMKLWYDKAVGASYILLSDPRTIEGIGALAAAGLITTDRRDAVLAGQAPA